MNKIFKKLSIISALIALSMGSSLAQSKSKINISLDKIVRSSSQYCELWFSFGVSNLNLTIVSVKYDVLIVEKDGTPIERKLLNLSRFKKDQMREESLLVSMDSKSSCSVIGEVKIVGTQNLKTTTDFFNDNKDMITADGWLQLSTKVKGVKFTSP